MSKIHHVALVFSMCHFAEEEDKERPGHPKKIEDEELDTLLDEDPCQTQDELAKSLVVDR